MAKHEAAYSINSLVRDFKEAFDPTFLGTYPRHKEMGFTGDWPKNAAASSEFWKTYHHAGWDREALGLKDN